MEQDATDAEKARAERCGRRAERKVCRCGARNQSRRRSRNRRQKIVSRNPFIIFYLEMYYKSPAGKHVTEVARQAGKEWCALPEEERNKYVRLAEKERKKYRRGGRRRRRGC